MANKDVYIVVVQDTIIQSREYCVLVPHGSGPDKAKELVQKGQFLTESEATTMDTLETKILSAEKFGETNESGRLAQIASSQSAATRRRTATDQRSDH